MARHFVFPHPNNYSATLSTVTIPPHKVIGLFNQMTGQTRKKISKNVRILISAVAKQHGWNDVDFYNGTCILRR